VCVWLVPATIDNTVVGTHPAQWFDKCVLVGPKGGGGGDLGGGGGRRGTVCDGAILIQVGPK
jgi:hypothetical protein